MESLVAVVTTTFQALLAVCVVFGLGYAYNGQRVEQISGSLASVARKVLLPCLVLTTFAASESLTWRRLIMLWPTIVVALVAHLASAAVSLLVWRFGKTEDWTVESMTFNNVASFPLLLLYSLHRVSPGTGLSHLKWRVMDTTDKVVERASLYILVNLLVVELARSVLRPLLLQIMKETRPSLKRADSADISPLPVASETNEVHEADAHERTPLIATSTPASVPPRPIHATILSVVSTPIVLAVIVGLLIGLVKPLQRAIVGVGADVDEGDADGSWIWLSLGSAIVLLGGAFAVVDTLAVGAGFRAGEKPASPEDKVPPTLGTVLLVVGWRYICIPAIILPIIYGFRKIPSTRVFLQDPSFTWVLALSTFAPPTLPPASSALMPYRSSVLFSTFLTSLILALPLALALAISGRGVSRSLDFDLMHALKSAGGGGLAGAAAMVVQVLTLMPMRTIMNYQYRYGGGLKGSTLTLWRDGGFKRYYAGLPAALFQGPLSRFGDTAANAGIIALLEHVEWPVLIKTIAASVASACFRMTLTPIDTLKTTQQTQGGASGLKLLRERIRDRGIASLWYGALATAAATFVGHYPWFGTYNYLQDALPLPHTIIQKLARQAFIGFSASVVSDTASNSLRVVKTYRQVHEGDVGYLTAAKEIVATEGLLGLFGRGLPTRLLTNGLQGILFSILWKFFADIISGGSGSGK